MRTKKECLYMINEKEKVIKKLWQLFLSDKIPAELCSNEIKILQYEIMIIRWFIKN